MEQAPKILAMSIIHKSTRFVPAMGTHITTLLSMVKRKGVGEGEIWKYGRGLVPIEANCISDAVPVKLIYDVTVNPFYPITPSQFNTDL